LVIGLETEVEVAGAREPKKDGIPGGYSRKMLPANTPLSIEDAARASGVNLKKARALQLDPAFGEAIKSAVETRRQCLEPRVLAMAVEIMDDRSNPPKDRIRAGQCILGPKPVQGGVTVNVAQQNNVDPHPAGYVIDLRSPAFRILKDDEPKIITASPRGNTGDVEADVEAERAEIKQAEAYRVKPLNR